MLRDTVYPIMTELIGEHDLPERTSALLPSYWYALLSCLHAAPQQDQPPASDWLTIVSMVLSVIGVSASCAWLVFYGLPAAVLALHGEIGLLGRSPPTKNVPALLDSVTALVMQVAWFALLAWSMGKKQMKRFSLKKLAIWPPNLL